ncbi:GNAT family N-acetyltransferase [Streptomyces luteogriseus]|uniref:GNAT family N-acetyltransferase n=1 Tax=Streptomyces luteogriseus TaxID=68233 RepID=UPI00379E1F3A
MTTDRPLTLRGITEADLPELLRLDSEVYPPYSYFVLRQFCELYEDSILVLDDGEGLCGYALFPTTRDGCLSWVLSLVVARHRQGRGLARRLVYAVLRRLREQGVREVRLTVEPGNTAAIALYESFGFSTEGGMRRDYFGPGEHRLVMSMVLG